MSTTDPPWARWVGIGTSDRAALHPGPEGENRDESDAAAAARRGGPVLLVLMAALLPLAAMVGWAAPRGLDRTDDGYYLTSIAHPADITTDLVAFGSVYHPIFSALGGDVAALRVAGACLTVASVAGLAWVVLSTPLLLGSGVPPRPRTRAAVALALGSAGLLSQTGLPPTPSYNTLVVQAFAGIAAGLVLALTRNGSIARAGWVLVGVSGWLAFLAKPPSAGLAAVLVLLAVACAPGRRRSAWVLPVATVLSAAVTLVAYQQHPFDQIHRIVTGIQALQALGSYEALVRFDPLPLRPLLLFPILLLALLVGLLSVTITPRVSRPLLALPLVAVAAFFVTGTSWEWARITDAGLLSRDGGFALALIATLGLMVLRLVRRRRAEPLAAVLLVVVFLLPAAASFGTNGNLWSASGRAAAFLMILLTARLVGTPGSLWLAPALTTALVLTPLQVAAAAEPYRYPALPLSNVTTDLGPNGSLSLTATDARQVRATVELGDRIGIRGRYVIDLTGVSPGTVFLLGGRPVGRAWFLGGYPGSETVARLTLDRSRCAALAADVLVDVSSPRRIDTRALGAIGRVLEKDYQSVGEIAYYRAADGGELAVPNARAVVYRPTATPSARCE